MIDIAKAASPAPKQNNFLVVVLLAALAFLIWDSNWLGRFWPDRDDQVVTGQVTNVPLIKCINEMTQEQAQVAASVVPDEICDQRNIKFRSLWTTADIQNADEWVRQLFSFYKDNAPCLATIDVDGNRSVQEMPASISQFRKLIGAK